MSKSYKSAPPSASPSPKRKQRKAISNEGQLDRINMCLIKVYTLLVSAVPTICGNARKIEESAESVTSASLTLLTQLLSPSPAFLHVCWSSSHPFPFQTQVWPAPQASLSHLIQLAPFDTHASVHKLLTVPFTWLRLKMNINYKTILPTNAPFIKT